MTEKNINLEQSLKDLESLVAELETGELPLEEAMKKFENGIKLTRACQTALKEAEQKVEDNDYIDQIKSVTQEKKINPVRKTEIDAIKKNTILSFDQLLEICNENKEMKLKYELEKNVNLVGFYKNRIEISFNDNLDKNFVKDLSLKLFEWTNQRWIITFSKTQGELSVKEKKENKKNELIERIKNTELYKNVIKNFPDAKLKDVNKLDGSDD